MQKLRLEMLQVESQNNSLCKGHLRRLFDTIYFSICIRITESLHFEVPVSTVTGSLLSKIVLCKK